MRVYCEENYQAMSRRAASIIAAQLIQKPESVLGLATGSTPIGTYEKLVEWCKDGTISFARAHSANLDEYVGLPGTHDQSYRYFMQKNLFDHVDIKPEWTNVPDGTAADSQAECARYDALIRSLGGVDLQLLGMGHNGHIGFNEPADAFPLGTHLVDLTETTIRANARFFASMEEVPRQALTMGVGTIMAARRVLVVVSGEDKADIVLRAFRGGVTPQVPASILQMHPDVTLVGDKAALHKLLEAGERVCG